MALSCFFLWFIQCWILFSGNCCVSLLLFFFLFNYKLVRNICAGFIHFRRRTWVVESAVEGERVLWDIFLEVEKKLKNPPRRRLMLLRTRCRFQALYHLQKSISRLQQAFLGTIQTTISELMARTVATSSRYDPVHSRYFRWIEYLCFKFLKLWQTIWDNIDGGYVLHLPFRWYWGRLATWMKMFLYWIDLVKRLLAKICDLHIVECCDREEPILLT